MSEKFSPTSRLGDLNDFIAPSQACVISLKGCLNGVGKIKPKIGQTQKELSQSQAVDPKNIVEVLEKYEAEADQVLLFRSQMVENDRERNANRETLTALRKKTRRTKTSVHSPFESMMKDTQGSSTKPLVQEVCSTCGSHDSIEPTWMMLPGADLFAAVPFHAVHTMLEKNEKKMEFEAKRLQSLAKEKTLYLSELGALADSIPPGVIRSLVALKDNKP